MMSSFLPFFLRSSLSLKKDATIVVIVVSDVDVVIVVNFLVVFLLVVADHFVLCWGQ